MGQYGTKLNLMGPNGTKWDHMGPNSTLWSRDFLIELLSNIPGRLHWQPDQHFEDCRHAAAATCLLQSCPSFVKRRKRALVLNCSPHASSDKCPLTQQNHEHQGAWGASATSHRLPRGDFDRVSKGPQVQFWWFFWKMPLYFATWLN